jgi:hypothetical protein
MNDSIRCVKAALRRLMTLSVLTLAACQSVVPIGGTARLDAVEPNAISAAKDRARMDLGCEADIATKVMAREGSEPGLYALDRDEYKIAATGCGKQILLTVACTRDRLCSALAEGAPVEAIKGK